MKTSSFLMTLTLIPIATILAQTRSDSPGPKNLTDDTYGTMTDSRFKRIPGAQSSGGNQAYRPRPASQTKANDAIADTELTRKIREELVKGDFSTAAKNITISTANGKVSLTGTVANLDERNKVDALAKKTAGATAVENNLAVSP